MVFLPIQVDFYVGNKAIINDYNHVFKIIIRII